MTDVLLYQGVVGLSGAMYLWLVAAGLSLIFGVLRIVNFAHGGFYMLGSYVAFTVTNLWGGNFWLSILLAPLAVAFVGWVMERFFFRRVYGLDPAFQLLLSFGFVLILNDVVKIVWGPMSQSPPTPELLAGAVPLFGHYYPTYNIFILVLGALSGLALWFLIERTAWGTMVRATAADREMACALGIHVPRLFTGVFVFGAWLAGLGGTLSVPIIALSPGIGESIIIEAFVIVVIGGLGSLKGAFIASIFIGLLHAFGVMFLPVFELALAYIVMAVVLIVRPSGMFGAHEA